MLKVLIILHHGVFQWFFIHKIEIFFSELDFFIRKVEISCMIKHEYNCCLSENIEDVETESDNANSKQDVNQLPVIENVEEKQPIEC